MSGRGSIKIRRRCSPAATARRTSGTPGCTARLSSVGNPVGYIVHPERPTIMLSFAVSALALTIRDTPASPALRLRGGGKRHAKIATQRATRDASPRPFLQTLDYTQKCLDRDTARNSRARAIRTLVIQHK